MSSTPEISFFPVGNGDMTLVKTGTEKYILVDCNIRSAADDDNDSTPDVGTDLRSMLPTDAQGRRYVDVFVLTHPDQDHCGGLRKHFHLGVPGSEIGEKIFIRELWSSPIVFRRASRSHTLCEDAKAFNTEAKRRVGVFRAGGTVAHGDRILILGKDEKGKTDDLTQILVEVGSNFDRVCGAADPKLRIELLGPLSASSDEENAILAKNRSSIVMNLELTSERSSANVLMGGDAEVEVWERLANERMADGVLDYDLLQAPHHCSWHSLSHDSWSELGEKAKVSNQARCGLGQARQGAVVVASSRKIKDDNNDPPCIRAKREYADIAESNGGEFICVGDTDERLEFEVGAQGLRRKVKRLAGGAATTSRVGAVPLPHG